MADVLDIAAVDPALELTVGTDSLLCRGTLNTSTRSFVLEAAEMLLAHRPPVVTIDISELHVADVDGADTFVHLQRMTREVGVELRWQGLDSDRLRGILPLGPFPGRRPPRHGPVTPHRHIGGLRRPTGVQPPTL